MKARTKIQFRITKLSDELPRITGAQEQWAFKNCLPHLGYANKSAAFCLDCGETFSLDLIKRKRAICPHCDTKLNIEFTRKTTNKEAAYFAITHIVEEFQVVEYFELFGHYKKGQPVKYFLNAILEDWIAPDGKVQKIGLLHSLNWNCDSWGGNWEIRQENKFQYYNNNKYDVYPQNYHPDSVFKPEYLKIGINHSLRGLTVKEAIEIIPNQPKAETLIKAKRYDLLGRILHNRGDVHTYWASIKIALRNKYKPSDVSIWFDYLDLLSYFRKDLRNAKYVCPKNLKAAHDRLVEKKRAKQKSEELERKRRDIEEAQIEYAKRIQPFLGLKFSDGFITVKVLESVKEFEQEGDLLKHCLFTNEYYKQEGSLILSARINDTPVETIEVNLSKMKIEQSRGLKNEPTEYNKKIVSLVKKNLQQIKKILKTA